MTFGSRNTVQDACYLLFKLLKVIHYSWHHLPASRPAGVPVEFVKVHYEPDGNFPQGIPNPILQERRASTAEAVIEHKADMGIAWDGDFDLFDEAGEFIEGYYIVGLLGEALLAHTPGEINSTVEDALAVIDKVLDAYGNDALTGDHTDGISVEMGQWRFNLRMSNTEPVIRLSVETRGDVFLMHDKTEELLELIRGLTGGYDSVPRLICQWRSARA